MRGFFLISLLLGLLYYSFLEKESAESNIDLLNSIKSQASEIADREDYRAEAARHCSSGDDEEVSDCLESTYRYDQNEEEVEDEEDSNVYSGNKSVPARKTNNKRSLTGKIRKFSSGTDIQGL